MWEARSAQEEAEQRLRVFSLVGRRQLTYWSWGGVPGPVMAVIGERGSGQATEGSQVAWRPHDLDQYP